MLRHYMRPLRYTRVLIGRNQWRVLKSGDGGVNIEQIVRLKFIGCCHLHCSVGIISNNGRFVVGKRLA